MAFPALRSYKIFSTASNAPCTSSYTCAEIQPSSKSLPNSLIIFSTTSCCSRCSSNEQFISPDITSFGVLCSDNSTRLPRIQLLSFHYSGHFWPLNLERKQSSRRPTWSLLAIKERMVPEHEQIELLGFLVQSCETVDPLLIILKLLVLVSAAAS